MARRGENINKRKDGRYEGRYVIWRTAQGHTKFGYVYRRTWYIHAGGDRRKGHLHPLRPARQRLPSVQAERQQVRED